jgi:hypothetical protein
LENRILKQYPPKDWEDIRMQYLNDCSTVVLHAKCHNCKWEDFVATNTIQFVNFQKENSAHGNCPICFSKEKIHMSTELPARPIRIAF